MPAEVIVTRSTNPWGDFFRSYQVVVDGEQRDHIRRGASATVSLDPGRHNVRVKISWCGSPTVALDLADGDRAYLDCGLYVPLLAWPLYLTIWRNRYLDLRLVRTERD